MTCVVAAVEDGVTYMMSDSLISDKYSKLAASTMKLFAHGEMMFGCAGSVRVMQAIEHMLELPDHTDDLTDMQYMVGMVIPAVHQALMDCGTVRVDDSVYEMDAMILVGYRGELYHIQSDYSVLRSDVPYLAIGSGMDVAMGALYATAHTDMDITDRLTLAVQAAAEFIPTVGMPDQSMSSEDLEDDE